MRVDVLRIEYPLEVISSDALRLAEYAADGGQVVEIVRSCRGTIMRDLIASSSFISAYTGNIQRAEAIKLVDLLELADLSVDNNHVLIALYSSQCMFVLDIYSCPSIMTSYISLNIRNG
jgi:hypothetical protein